MRKILLTLTILIIAVFSADAQFSIGAKGGTTNTLISTAQIGEDNQGTTTRYTVDNGGVLRFQGGLVANYAFSDRFSLQGEVLYRGLAYETRVRVDNNLTATTFTEDLSADYLTVPLAARFSFGNKVKFYTQLGPQIGFWLGAKQKNNLTIFDKNANEVVLDEYEEKKYEFYNDDSDDIVDNKIDLGIHGGIGVAFQVGNRGQIFVEADYAYGFKGFREFKNEPRLKHDVQAFTTAVGYMIRLGGNAPRGR